MKRFLPFVYTLLILVSCNETGSGKIAPEKEDTGRTAPPEVKTELAKLPNFQLLDRNDQQVDIASMKGKKLFVNLWATWCPPCRAEIPSIERLASKVDKDKVAFVMLSLDDNFAKAKNYAKKNKMNLPLYYPAENLPPMFAVNAIPVTFIFNENGELMKVMEGSADYDTKEYVELLNK
jgi:thiol-disulfide isomerase/thioredoxin